MNIKFVFDLIDSQILGINEDYSNSLISHEDMKYSIRALSQFRKALLQFIKDTKEIK